MGIPHSTSQRRKELTHQDNIFFLKTKLNARLALWQTGDLLKANISANKISLPQGQGYTERKHLLTAPKWLTIN